ncbi:MULTISPECIES: class I SAM-dependent methyltransferase [unclassified Streptomyces]|uniref:class I SAM-dependent methyltransferase n=1 Tax=unclassified Streptomyces TaxID=2593676 RepID=UPI0003659160|nr:MULTISPECIES: class I SAM-dependent methyltransferase [unclassified Streptomyces]MYY04508.1 methyltransferase domain-containing protein [Streptomyces sp. SID4913]
MTPTAERVRQTPYVELLAMLGESNLPPGGLATVRTLAQNLHLRPGIRALHAGCNAGFLSREMARRTGVEVVGVDISPAMAEAARLRAKEEDLHHLVSHECQDMRRLTFADETFDVVFSGGALAFVRGHDQAVAEMIRVTKQFGLIGDTQLYYAEEPPAGLLDRVSEIIEVPVPQYSREYWTDLYRTDLLQPYWREDTEAGSVDDADVEAYARRMTGSRAADWSEEAQEALYTRLLHIFRTFNENMKYLRCTNYAYRRLRADSEPALFV